MSRVWGRAQKKVLRGPKDDPSTRLRASGLKEKRPALCGALETTGLGLTGYWVKYMVLARMRGA